MDLASLAADRVLRRGDVSEAKDRARQVRLSRLVAALSVVLAVLVGRDAVGLARLYRGDLAGARAVFGWPSWHLPPGAAQYAPQVALIAALVAVLAVPLLGAGRSPHILYRPEDIPVRLSDVKGAPVVVEEVVRTLNLFLAYRSFQERMGGNPRRAILFEGPPGTGKTYIAKAMAAEAGVPFLFVSSSAFQSMFYGQTNRKIRSFFKALRRYARREGGAIGFIEEIDAIAASRSGLGHGGREGIAGVVNELLVQLQSFETPTWSQRLAAAAADALNAWLPKSLRLPRPVIKAANILVIGATNRAGDLDPALLRPGRFDRTITVDLPSRAGRREIIDYYLARKAHDPELDNPAMRDALAAGTIGYSPVMLEHLFDEALVWALRRGADRLEWSDLQQAKLTAELGLAQPVTYSPRERLAIATHEAGHATVAWLVAPERILEVLSIVKRSSSLGLLAHSGAEERYTQTRGELEAALRISMGGLVAEELFLGDTTSGVAGDLSAATATAAAMVGGFGMAGSLISFEAASVPGAGNLTAKVLADEQGRLKVDQLLEQARQDVRDLLGGHSHLVVALRDALLERDELVGAEITEVLERAAAQTEQLGGTEAGVSEEALDLRDPR